MPSPMPGSIRTLSTISKTRACGSMSQNRLYKRSMLNWLKITKVIEDGQVWIDMLNHRNLLSHTYDCAMFEAAVEATADRYLPAMATLRQFLSKERET